MGDTLAEWVQGYRDAVVATDAVYEADHGQTRVYYWTCRA